MMKKYTKGKVPYFFKYAKDKEDENVEAANNSTMNRVVKAISSDRLDFEFSKIKEFNKEMLMAVSNRKVSKEAREEIIRLYKHYNVTRNHRVSYEDREKNNLKHSNSEIRKVLVGSRNKDFVLDVLVRHLFEDGVVISKSLLWDCFGRDIVKNIKKNLEREYGTLDLMYCEICGERFVSESNSVKYCKECAREKQLEWQRESMRKSRELELCEVVEK